MLRTFDGRVEVDWGRAEPGNLVGFDWNIQVGVDLWYHH